MKNAFIFRSSCWSVFLALATLSLVSFLPVEAASATAPQLIPQPASMRLGTGSFALTPNTVLVARSQEAQQEARMFSATIAPATGFAPRVVANTPGSSAIVWTLDANAATGDEGYRLTVTPNGVTVVATKSTGLFYGAQTLRQLLPPAVFAPTLQKGVVWQMPAVTIEDAPRFAWRGLMLDSGRHFFSVPEVKRFIDIMSLHKFNTLHWHLTDDQGWRLEIKKYPRLTAVGSKRAESPMHDNDDLGDGTPYGGFYTQEQAREVVAYAAARHINIVPEIEMPGHAEAALAAYPDFGNSDVPQYQPIVQTRWWVHPYTYAPKAETFAFLEDVLREVLAIFPSPMIHIGGDEAPKRQWEQSPFARDFMAKNGLKDGRALQSYFITRMERFLNANGRQLIGWDEILEGGLAPHAAVMAWRGEAGAVAAAGQEHPVVMASRSAYYLDYPQNRGVSSLRHVYNFDPHATIPAAQRHWLLGVEGELWTEHIWDNAKLEYLTYPRACALAETAWSPPTRQNFDNFMARMQTHVARLRAMGINVFPFDAGGLSAGTWQSDQIGEQWTQKEWDITPRITKAGAWEISFEYSSGAHRLDIAWSELLQNGVAVARDEHAGTTGARTTNNVYRLILPQWTPGAHYVLRAQVRADAGNDSNGDIFVVAR